MREAYRERAHALISTLEGSQAVSARLPEGGMFVMLDIRNTGLTGEQFAWRLLDEHNVGTMPGESFGSGGAGHVRVALTVESELLKEASTRIRRLADTCLTERK